MTYYSEKGVKRFINSIFFSFAGFKAAWKYEEAFRQEVVIFFISIPIAYWLGENNIERVLLIASVALVLLVELINSALEAVIDRIGVEFHELAGRAKDIGSAAVMLAMLMVLFTWISILL